jgi:hypothetical protein
VWGTPVSKAPSRARSHLALAAVLASAAAACFAGERTTPGTGRRNLGTLSLVTAREQAGGKNEGPLGFSAPVSRSELYEELSAKGIRAETLGPLNQIKDPKVLTAVMTTFSRALGVRCSWCHIQENYAAPTARKAVAAYMWDVFVAQMELADGGPLYCDSCHHQSTVFLRRNASEKLALARYMQLEYVDQLRRRDGGEQGCKTCHSEPFNPRFLPRISDPEGYHAPVAHPGPQP